MISKRVALICLVVYVVAAVVAIQRFSEDRLPSQLAGWVGGLMFGVLFAFALDFYRERKRRQSDE